MSSQQTNHQIGPDKDAFPDCQLGIFDSNSCGDKNTLPKLLYCGHLAHVHIVQGPQPTARQQCQVY